LRVWFAWRLYLLDVPKTTDIDDSTVTFKATNREMYTNIV